MNTYRFQWLVLRSLLWLIGKNGATNDFSIYKDLQESIDELGKEVNRKNRRMM